MGSLRKEFLELLDRDLEFRYAVAGYLGLGEILKRLDSLSEEQVSLRKEQVRLREEQVRLREEQTKIWKEIAGLREEQVSLREEQTKIWGEIARLREEQVRLREEQTKIWGEIARLREEQVSLRKEQVRLREEQTKIWGEIARLREDFNKMYKMFDARLGRVERTLEKLTVDIEDEARSFVKHRLKEMGVSLELGSLTLPDLEINLYGVSDNICLIGEATVRGGPQLAKELLEKLEKLKNKYPEKLRRKTILVIYASLPTIELVEKAKEQNIWLLKATQEFHKPEKLFFEI